MVRPQDFLEFARALLVGKQISEMHARQAAARAYYSVLLLIRDQLRREGEIPSKDTHGLVKSMLNQAAREPGSAEYLTCALKAWKTLIDNREDADYKISMNFETHRGLVSLNHAEKIFREFDAR
jgi:uncharacterized protein (UPF0332 family)